MEIKPVAMYEETDSELAKYNITSLSQKLEKYKNIVDELEKELNTKINSVKTIKEMLGKDALIVNPHIDILNVEYKYFLDKLNELKGDE